MVWQGSVPGKTFLFGEYLALRGGLACVLATNPQFSLKVDLRETPSRDVPFFEGSPAYNLFQDHQEKLKAFSFEFSNPYGAGGFGASSAEFVLLAQFLNAQFNLRLLPEKNLDLAVQVLDFYFSFEKSIKRSSGCDVLTQWMGTSILWNREQNQLNPFRWPFEGVRFTLFSTGVKVATHTHVSSLDALPEQELAKVAQQIHESILEKQSSDFIEGMKKWTEILRSNNLEIDSTRALCDQIHSDPSVLFSRGCGALGADVILVLHRNDFNPQSFAKTYGLRFQAGLNDLCEVEK